MIKKNITGATTTPQLIDVIQISEELISEASLYVCKFLSEKNLNIELRISATIQITKMYRMCVSKNEGNFLNKFDTVSKEKPKAHPRDNKKNCISIS
ncbi:hypothetical protein [Thermosulfidibacter takaii]|uniref:hypothetical protein n=1 Tax=Thermosulfidibacter takaii TaxID=412593 RepID=UPI0011876F5F|nr:hypothetical protein [Thermosulfidibacter takaii]